MNEVLRAVTVGVLAVGTLVGCARSTAFTFDIHVIDTSPLVEYHTDDYTVCRKRSDPLPEITIKDASGTIVAIGTMNAIGKWSRADRSCVVDRQITDVPSSDFYTVEIAFDDGKTLIENVKKNGADTLSGRLDISH